MIILKIVRARILLILNVLRLWRWSFRWTIDE